MNNKLFRFSCYENGTLKRILVDGGYYENGKYYFYIQDHLGNNRVVADQNETVVQSTQYYPFGMSFADEVETSKQPYKYGGKELDKERGLNWYDFEARNYDTALGRFTTVDPMAEKYYGWSPYAYCANNPMRITDPTGMDWFVDGETGNIHFFRNISDLRDLPTEVQELYQMDFTDPKRYENLGGDDLFSLEEVIGGNLLFGYSAGEDGAESFMKNQGYEAVDRIYETRSETTQRYVEVDGGMFKSDPVVNMTIKRYKSYSHINDLYKRKDDLTEVKSSWLSDTKIYKFGYKVPKGASASLPIDKDKVRKEKNLDRTNKVIQFITTIFNGLF